MIVSDNLM